MTTGAKMKEIMPVKQLPRIIFRASQGAKVKTEADRPAMQTTASASAPYLPVTKRRARAPLWQWIHVRRGAKPHFQPRGVWCTVRVGTSKRRLSESIGLGVGRDCAPMYVGGNVHLETGKISQGAQLPITEGRGIMETCNDGSAEADDDCRRVLMPYPGVRFDSFGTVDKFVNSFLP